MSRRGCSPEVAQQIVQFFEKEVPFHRHLGVRCTRVESGFARLVLPFRPEFIGDPYRPALHGGLTSMLADSAGGAAVWSAATTRSTTKSRTALSTVDLRVDFLRPGREEDLVAEARVVRLGNRVGVADVVVFHPGASDRPIATGKAVYNVAQERSSSSASE